MPEKLCGTCKWWGRIPVGGLIYSETGPFKTCGAIEHSLYMKDDDVAYVEDGSDCWAALKCREDFGCKLWETKDA